LAVGFWPLAVGCWLTCVEIRKIFRYTDVYDCDCVICSFLYVCFHRQLLAGI